MAYETNLSGVLYPNDQKGNDKAPSHRGECEIEGKKYEIAGWKGTSKTGKPYMSLKFQVPRATKVAGDDDTKPRKAQSVDDDLAF